MSAAPVSEGVQYDLDGERLFACSNAREELPAQPGQPRQLQAQRGANGLGGRGRGDRQGPATRSSFSRALRTGATTSARGVSGKTVPHEGHVCRRSRLENERTRQSVWHSGQATWAITFVLLLGVAAAW
jgi:hypothetical protein